MYLGKYETKFKKYVAVWYNFTTLLKIYKRMKFVNINQQFNQQCTVLKNLFLAFNRKIKLTFIFSYLLKIANLSSLMSLLVVNLCKCFIKSLFLEIFSTHLITSEGMEFTYFVIKLKLCEN
jgi:hypothetical protein